MVNKLMVVDVESGGLSATEHSILTFGAVILDQGKIIDSMHIAIAEPKIVATQQALLINKIDLEQLKRDGFSIGRAVGEINGFTYKHFGVSRANLAGQNIAFDISFMQRLWRLVYEHDWRNLWESMFNHRTYDTMHVLRFLGEAGALPFTSGGLLEAANWLNINVTGLKEHNALDDATVTAKVLVGLTEYVKNMSRVYRGESV